MPLEHRLPFKHNLFIATPNSIYLHSQAGDKVLFQCDSSNGIVNALASRDNNGLLAVADSQIVILHDTARNRDRKHKLKGGDVTSVLVDSMKYMLTLTSG
jgi:hypothetical protein